MVNLKDLNLKNKKYIVATLLLIFLIVLISFNIFNKEETTEKEAVVSEVTAEKNIENGQNTTTEENDTVSDEKKIAVKENSEDESADSSTVVVEITSDEASEEPSSDDKDTKESTEAKNYLLIGNKNIFAVYGGKLSIQIPAKVTLDGEKEVADYLADKEYKLLLSDVNEILPEPLSSYSLGDDGIEIDTAHKYQIPQMKKAEKNLILTSDMNAMFQEFYFDDEEKLGFNNILVDILNANGRGGYAGATGRKLKNALGVKYNASNHSQLEEYSYLLNKDLNEEQLNQLLVTLDEKYLKVLNSEKIPTAAAAVVIMGKEQAVTDKIYLYTKTKDEDIKKTLDTVGYKNVSEHQLEEEIDESYIEYAPEDYYIAKKLGLRLGIEKFLEKGNLSDRINIYIVN